MTTEKEREYQRTYRERHKDRLRASHNDWMRRWRAAHPGATYHTPRAAERRRESESILATVMLAGCIDCGIKDPLVLQFDHVRGVKTGTVLTYRNSPTRLKKELAKCDVRCANCHLRQSRLRGQFRKPRAA